MSSLSKGTVLLTSLLTVRWNDQGEAVRRLAPGSDTLDTPPAYSHIFYLIYNGSTIALNPQRGVPSTASVIGSGEFSLYASGRGMNAVSGVIPPSSVPSNRRKPFGYSTWHVTTLIKLSKHQSWTEEKLRKSKRVVRRSNALGHLLVLTFGPSH